MARRPFWGWFIHRVEDTRGSLLLMDQQENEVRNGGNTAPSYFNDEIYERCWGGIPLTNSLVIFINYHRLG